MQSEVGLPIEVDLWNLSCALVDVLREAMAPTVYYFEASPPARTVLLTARAIGLELNKKLMNLANKEHLTPEFLKINPQHSIPTFVDGDVTLCDSHVIATYLVGTYASDDSLYPKDLKQRALVDQGLYFEAVTLFPRLKAIFKPILYLEKTTVDQGDREALHEAFAILETFLEGKQWVAGNKLTLADFACVTSVGSLVEAGLDVAKYPNVKAWLSRCQKEISGYTEVNEPGFKQLKEKLKSLPPGQL